MKKFDFKNIPLLWQTFLGIILTIAIVLGVSTFITVNSVNNNFDNFIVKQGETLGRGYGREISEIYKEERHKQIVEEFKQTVIESTLLSVGLAVVISSVLAYFFSKKITKPLSKLHDSINSVSNLKSIEHISTTGTKEINDLAISFNAMIDRLINLEEMRDDLVDDVVHELRTPLARIVGDLEGVQDKIYEADEQVISRVLKNSYRLDTLINRLTHFANIRAGKIKMEKEKVSISKMIDEVISAIDPNATTNLHIKNLVDKKVFIEADPQLLKEVFENLINNAIKYTPKGFIYIVYEKAKSQLLFIDSGIGIEKKDKKNIFERFYRIDKSRNVKSGGLGLGLAIVREIVEAHGWEISVASPLSDLIENNTYLAEILINENQKAKMNISRFKGSVFIIDNISTDDKRNKLK